MPKKPSIKIGDIYESNNYGSYEVVDYVNTDEVKVRFIETGYSYWVGASQIKRGTVRDRFFPNTFGIGYFGDGAYSSRVNGKITVCYSSWCGMMERCYSSRLHECKNTYRDCEVCEEWHNFQNFAKWFEDNYIEGYDLDKDIKIEGNKLYSPETCMFVSKYKNNMAAQANKMKHWCLKSPTNALVYIFNVNAFCYVRGLSRSSIHKLLHRGIANHKGWRLYNSYD